MRKKKTRVFLVGDDNPIPKRYHEFERANVHTIIDTFPAFLNFWTDIANKPLDEQIDGWAADYLSQWPELLTKQINDYAQQALDWRQIAREKVFPFLHERLPAMKEAHRNLLELCGSIHEYALRTLGFDNATTIVIYVGIGCGAGWVTTLNNSPAVLFGLENIAERGWSDTDTLQGLIAHEFGHLVHYSWRAQAGKPSGTGPWWQLYEEGFAQTCENRILGVERVHQANPAKEQDWLTWCQEHTGLLASEFLKTVDSGSPVTAFFGSWYQIWGRSETGYFLGLLLIKELERQLEFKDIALLEQIESVARPILTRLAGL